ncbi:protein rogdi-like [Babylonia areolata]|uniref:protein rogdi-like n=1 Tax=Babylonia areolata TaxID=304850 RepID=UPI003FCFF432
MATADEVVEKSALRAELKWLLREEVHSVLDIVDHTLQECSRFFPIELPGNSDRHEGGLTNQTVHRGTQRLLLTTTGTATPGVLKCMMTLKGDSISEADVQFNFKVKDKGKDGPLQKTSIQREKQWTLHQIRDAANHLEEALQIVSLRRQDHQFHSAQEVLMLMERLTKNVQSCRECLSIPKRKSLQDLANNKSRDLFNPPLPQNVAMSFYIHGAKVILAIYQLHVNGQQKVDVSQRIQMEAVVRWLNEIVVLCTLALQQCQQLVDKITTVCQCAGVDRGMYVT